MPSGNLIATAEWLGRKGLVSNQMAHDPDPQAWIVYTDIINDQQGRRRKRPGSGSPVQAAQAAAEITQMHEFVRTNPATGVVTYYKFQTYGTVIRRWNDGTSAWDTCALGGVVFSGTAWQFCNSRNRCFAINGVDGIFYFDGTTGPDGREWYVAGVAAPTVNLGYTLSAVDPPYSTGSVTVTKGAKNVVGSGATTWVTTGAWSGKFIDIAGVRYTIDTVTVASPGQLTLVEDYRGESAAGVLYTIYIGLMDWSEPPQYSYAYKNSTSGHISNIGPILQLTEKDRVGRTPRISGIPYSPTDYNNGYDLIQMFRSAKNGSVLVAIDPASGGTIANSNAAGSTTFTETANTYRDVNLTKFAAPLVSNRKPLSGSNLSALVTGATNATPIVITTGTNHGLATGQIVVISGVGGNTAANGTWIITVTGAATFSLNTSAGNGAYTSGGVVTLAAAFSAIAEWNGRLWALAPREGLVYYSASLAEIEFGRSDECWPANNALPVTDARGLLRVGRGRDDTLLIQTGGKDRIMVGFNILNYDHDELGTDDAGGALPNATLAQSGSFVALYRDKRLIDYSAASAEQPDLGRDIQDKLNAIPAAYLEKCRILRFSNQAYNLLVLAVPSTGGSTANDRTYVYDYDSRCWYDWTLSITAMMVAHDATTGALELWAAIDRRVFKLLQAGVFTDNGANITPAMKSAQIRFFGYGKRGFLKWLKVFVNDPAQTWRARVYVDEDTVGTLFDVSVPNHRWQSANGKEMILPMDTQNKQVGEVMQIEPVWPTIAGDLVIEKLIAEANLDQDVEATQ